jgi:hypothetical protein
MIWTFPIRSIRLLQRGHSAAAMPWSAIGFEELVLTVVARCRWRAGLPAKRLDLPSPFLVPGSPGSARGLSRMDAETEE